MKKIKNAFTLIELLAVIIILAIVALIAVPIILDVIDDARISAGKSEANMILGGITNYCATEDVKYQMDNSYVRKCTTDLDVEKVKELVNLGNAEITSITYDGSKLTELVIESNNHTFTLCPSGQFAMDGEECTPSLESISFAEDSWETISAIVKAGRAEEFYNVGDTKEVTVEGYTNGDEDTFTVRIANMSTPDECNTEGFSQTACGFVVEFVDIITKYNMNYSSTGDKYGATCKGGWPASTMYNFVNNDIYNALSNELKNVIIDTYSVSGYGSDDISNFISTDKLYLLSIKEVWGIEEDKAAKQTRQLDYYINNGITIDSYSGAVKTYQGSANKWWLRSAGPENYSFFFVDDLGDRDSDSAHCEYGVVTAFRIG